MAPRLAALLVWAPILAACGEGLGSSPTEEGRSEESPAVVEPMPPRAVGESFDPAGRAPTPPAVSGTWSQTTVNVDEGELRILEQTYRDGSKKSRRHVKKTPEGIVNHGPYVRWYRNGVVAEEGEFRDGERDGVFIERFDTGQMKSEIEWEAGQVHGTKREWSDIGFVKKEAEFRHGVLHGRYATYGMVLEDQRFVRISGRFDEGVKVGPWTYAYGGGEKRDAGEFVNGLREGLWTTWHENGTLELEAHYRAGQWHGTVAEYDGEGRPLSTGTYVDGTLEGMHTTFFPSGAKRAEKTYLRGKPNGAAATWFDGGPMESRGEFVDGRQEGEWTYWNADGSLNEEWTGLYRDGERVSTDG